MTNEGQRRPEAARDVIFRTEGLVAHLTINRPERRNAISNEVLAGLRDGVERARADDAVRVLVLSGAGDRAFCAGGDLRQMGAGDAACDHEARGQLGELFLDLWRLGKPTIAKVQGYALAGGMGLALACDFVISSTAARFGVPEVKVGLWPYMVTIPLLRSMPPKVVLQLMLTGRQLDAEEAHRLGCVSHLVEPEALDDAVAMLIEELAAAAPRATRLGRMSFYSMVSRDDEVKLRMLQASLTVNLGTAEAAEGMRAFAERRPPSWRLEPHEKTEDGLPS